MTRDEAIKAWMAARDTAQQWVKHERQLRDYIVATSFGYDPVVGNLDGTKNLELGNGWILKGVFGKTYSIKEDDKFALARQQLLDMPVPSAIPVVKYKPAISTTGWKAASPQVIAILSPCVTMKPTAPQLTVEQKK